MTDEPEDTSAEDDIRNARTKEDLDRIFTAAMRRTPFAANAASPNADDGDATT